MDSALRWIPTTPIPEIRDVMPGKYSAHIARDRPTASKFNPPRYEETTEIPIFAMIFNKPWSIAFL